jgi:hypothetical protein
MAAGCFKRRENNGSPGDEAQHRCQHAPRLNPVRASGEWHVMLADQVFCNGKICEKERVYIPNMVAQYNLFYIHAPLVQVDGTCPQIMISHDFP